MAPSATSHNSPQEASGDLMENELDGQMMGSNEAPSSDPTKLYTDACECSHSDFLVLRPSAHRQAGRS